MKEYNGNIMLEVYKLIVWSGVTAKLCPLLSQLLKSPSDKYGRECQSLHCLIAWLASLSDLLEGAPPNG